MTKVIKKIHWLLGEQFGLDFLRLARSLRGIPRYVGGLYRFRQGYKGRLDLLPCLHDWYEEGGATRNEYFTQDLYVARKIYHANPLKHVDIGSRLDGFVAHVASFREIEVFDIRPVTSAIPGIIFRQADLMAPSEKFVGYCDSLSCLHALEHFGLGRYGDPIDPDGYAKGLSNMTQMLQPGGVFYLSVPIGEERVEFNGHRIFAPSTILQLAQNNALILKEFAWVMRDGTMIESVKPDQDMSELAKQPYTLGIFTFVKK